MQRVVPFALGVFLAAACESPPPAPPVAVWAPPLESEIPNDSLGASIRRGLTLIRFTPESLPKFATSNLRCTSCHQADGRKQSAAPLVASFVRYPKYLPRTGAVVTMADRVNYCFTRSLAGNALPYDSREMADIIAYLAFLSRGAPWGTSDAPANNLPPMTEGLVGEAKRGEALFETKRCAACHGSAGTPVIAGVPSLWGPKAYAIGASMAREERAASFIFHNMPQDAPGTLTPQEAFDLAAYVNAQERPDSPGKEHDYPAGGAPKDTPYATRGQAAFRPPAKLLPRANATGATVPAPPSVSRRTRQAR
jgi:thiosulfate dehydrogenase